MLDSPNLSRGNISVFDDGWCWEIDGVRRKSEDAGAIPLHIDDLKNVSISQLRSVLRRLHELDLDTTIDVVTKDSADFDPEFVLWSGISFFLHEDQLCLGVETLLDPPDPLPTSSTARSRIKPLLERKRLKEIEVHEDLDDSGDFWRVAVKVTFNARGRTFSSLASDAADLQALIEASPGQLTPSTLCDLIRSGHAEALLGQIENRWLEVKRQHYDLNSDYGKIRLAQTVAQFANTESGGVVVVGLESRKRDGFDTINAVTPMPHDRNIRRKYVQIINTRVYPPIEQLNVETVPVPNGDLLLIEIPSQVEELKPFFVHGAIVEDRTLGTFISIVQRGDEEVVSSHPAAIHSMLAVGRAFLRRGEMPDA